MRAIDFPEANKFYGKPESMTDEECYPISALEFIDEKGFKTIRTVWLPNKDDLEALNAGRPIVLSLCLPVLCPHSLFTYDENGNINE